MLQVKNSSKSSPNARGKEKVGMAAMEEQGKGKPEEEEEEEENDLPCVLLLKPPHPIFEQVLVPSFRFLKPWESDSPLEMFLASYADSIRVILSVGPSPVTADVIQHLPRLECVVAASTGVNHIDVAACKERGIAVCNAGTVFSDDVADCAVGLLLDVLRRISASDRYVRKGLWSVKGEFPLANKVGGKRVGIVGLGRIGSAVAKRMVAFGCSISYYSRTKKPSVPFTYVSSVLELATHSDALIVCCALTQETFHIINKDVLSALGKNGVIINVGRGPLVDEKELVRCLVAGEVGGAGLDVFENEPHVSNELFVMDNVVLSPHRGGATPASLLAMKELVIANLEAFFSNKPLLSPLEY